MTAICSKSADGVPMLTLTGDDAILGMQAALEVIAKHAVEKALAVMTDNIGHVLTYHDATTALLEAVATMVQPKVVIVQPLEGFPLSDLLKETQKLGIPVEVTGEPQGNAG
jgi:hypothetical protein